MLEFLESFLTFISPEKCLLQCLEEGQAFVRYFRDEPIECCYPSYELLEFFDGLR